MHRPSIGIIQACVVGIGSFGAGCRPAPPPPEIWEREPDYYVQHAILGHIHRPSAVRTTQVPTHPQGAVTLRTEARGFRSDTPIAVPKPTHVWRALVVGDSHIDGVVDNTDHLVEVLRRDLTVNARAAGHAGTIEVVNGATGYWGPAQYGLAFSVWAELEPDLCIVVLYEGNDFLDAVAAEERAGRTGLQRLPDHYDRLYALQDVVGERVSQQLNQDLLFSSDPSAADASVDHTVAALQKAAADCADLGASTVVARLPPVGAVHPPTETEAAQILDQLGDVPLLSGRQLGDRVTQAVADSVPRIHVVDLWPALYRQARGLPVPVERADPWESEGIKTAPQSMFWPHDHHLSVAGHAVAAHALTRGLLEQDAVLWTDLPPAALP